MTALLRVVSVNKTVDVLYFYEVRYFSISDTELLDSDIWRFVVGVWIEFQRITDFYCRTELSCTQFR
jgi:hypothetical protein